MTVGHEVLLGGYGLATIVGAILTVVLWRHRAKTGAVPLAATLLGTVVVSGSRFVATAADSYALSVLMERTLYVGIGLSVLALVVFALVYTGREQYVTPKTVGLLSIEPILVVALAFSNPGTVFFESIAPDPTMATGVAVEWGIAFGVHTIYSYALLAVSTFLILDFLFTSRGLYRGQALALLGGTTLPWVANAVHVVGPVSADTTPIGYVIVGGLYAFAIVRYRLGDVVPIARDRVLDTVTESIFVLDQERRLVDVNPAGRDLLGVDRAATIIGRDVRSILADEPALEERFHELTASREPTMLEVAYENSHYEAQARPIGDGRDRHVGWLVLVSDVTERKRREEELRRRNDRLDEFAQVVSHDLRNPLTVASGHLELARETGDLSHLESVDRAHDRMETIIEEVLTLARTDDPVTDPEPVSLATVADRAWETVDTGGANYTIESDLVMRADPSRVTRLLENLFRNSLEHGVSDDAADSAPLEITVGHLETAETDAPEGFFVADDGTGIPDSERDRIFDDGYSTGADGAGLGLSIVEQIATTHGWSVQVTDSETGGARFEFTGLETTPQATADPSS